MVSVSHHPKRKFEGCLPEDDDGDRTDDPLIVYPSPTKKGKKNISENPPHEKKKKSSEFLIQSKKKTPVEIMKDDDDNVEVGRSIPDTILRSYQLEILHVAMERNTLVFLETGCGKTLIAVQLMNQIAHKLRVKGKKSLIVFLAPKIQLVIQQAEVIRINTDLKVADYYGAKCSNGWNVQQWKRETTLNEVLVMTPQILLDGLQFRFLTLDLVDLLIFDECHHAWGQNPYAKIMKDYYNTCQHKPKIFGMTASPLIGKGASSNTDCEDQILKLEDILDSKVYTLEDRTEVDVFVPTPNQITKYYCKPSSLYNPLKLKLVALRDKEIQNHLSHHQFKDEENFMKKAKKKIEKIHGNIVYCLENLGFFCAYKAVQFYFEKPLEKMQGSTSAFLTDALELFQQAMPSDVDNLFRTKEGILDAVKRDLLTPKVHLLVQLILQQRSAEEMCCIIFVERVIVAAVISSLMQQLDCLSFVISDYLSRATSALCGKKQRKTLRCFSIGKVNVLVATDVVEEGIDVRSCSCVIRFDLPKTVRSFIQSRGRARQNKSNFILLLERGNEKQQKLLYEIIRSEESMKEMTVNRNLNHIPCIQEQSSVETNVYRVSSSGATVTCDSSVSLIYKYCAKLPGDKYYSPRPEFIARKVAGEDNLYECILKLPPNAPFQEVISSPNEKLASARQLICLEACKRLHEVGALDEHLQPVTEELLEEEEIMNSQGKRSTNAGTTKRKELHSSKAYALSGTWGEKLSGVTFQVYKLCFTSQGNEDRSYANLVLLIEEILDKDIANAETDLFLTGGRVVKSFFLHCGDMELDSSQLKDAKVFQETLFNGVFAKLLCRDRQSEGSRIMGKNVLKIMEMKNLWVSSNMYFLLPIESDEFGVSQREANIDWHCIRSCATGATLFKYLFISETDNNVRDILEVLVNRTLLQYSDCKEETLTLASGIHKASDLIDKAIVTVHTGKIYSVVEVICDKTAKSPFPKSKDPKVDHCCNYYDYFEKKYGKKLKHVNQPLLRVKQTHRPHNLLTNHSEELKARGQSSTVDEANFVELPPELCLDLGVPSSVIRSLYLVPSVMHRLNSLVLAGQLRKVIREERPKCPLVPAALIMEALTTLRCLECCSYERLELLGDSFLKYAISCHLFLKYEKKHEGQLSERRAWGISNATLHRLAMTHNLPEYIRDEPFDARRWVAPGMLCRRLIPCCCNIKNLNDNTNCFICKEDKVVKIGRACDAGHRWMCSKTISDAVEALIGAHLVGGGAIAALEFMKWMNMEVEFERGLAEAAFQRAFVYPSVLRNANLNGLESLLGYNFQNKALLVEAITHASQQDPEGGCCYQRLEFLGDSVLDLLITQHLYSAYSGLSPGYLTDLRSAAVNNENFAQAAVKHGIQKYLRHGSGALLNQITKFVKVIGQSKEGECRFMSFGGVETGPKVLADLIESIAGAILVDTRFDLECVWEIMKPILSPIVTPETLDLHPLRELQELCCQYGYSLKWKLTKKGDVTVALGEVHLEESIITGTGSKANKKTAKMAAAQQILLLMEERGLFHSRRHYVQSSLALTGKVSLDTTSICFVHEKMDCVLENANKSNEGKDEPKGESSDTTNGDSILKVEQVTMEEKTGIPNAKIGKRRKEEERVLHYDPVRKKPRLLKISENLRSYEDLIVDESDNALVDNVNDISNENWSHDGGLASEVSSPHGVGKISTLCSQSGYSPVILQRTNCQGFPRTVLYEICTKNRWAVPAFELVEERGMPHVRSFAYSVHIPCTEFAQVCGETKPNKKSAQDAASFKMLCELEKRGISLELDSDQTSYDFM